MTNLKQNIEILKPEVKYLQYEALSYHNHECKEVHDIAAEWKDFRRNLAPVLPLEKLKNNPATKPAIEDVIKAIEHRQILNDRQQFVNQYFSTSLQARCGRMVIPNQTPEMWASITNTAHYKNLFRCGAVFACPECSYKIRTERRNEFMTIFKGWQGEGRNLIFITLTNRHKKTDNIYYSAKQTKEYATSWENITTKNGTYNRLKKLYSVEFIRTVEFTYSYKNGFHPHLHIVLSYIGDKSAGDSIAQTIKNNWLNIHKNADKKYQDIKHVGNLDKDYQKNIADYLADIESGNIISKKNVAHELTNSKQSKKNDVHISPMSIPQMVIDKEFKVYSEKQLIEIYKEFLYIVKGLRYVGKSRSLKRFLEEKDDKQIVTDTSKLLWKIMTIDRGLWNLLLKKGLKIWLQKEITMHLHGMGRFVIKEIIGELERKLNECLHYDKDNLLRIGDIGIKNMGSYSVDTNTGEIIN